MRTSGSYAVDYNALGCRSLLSRVDCETGNTGWASFEEFETHKKTQIYFGRFMVVYFLGSGLLLVPLMRGLGVG